MGRKKSAKRQYFDDAVGQAIVDFKNADNLHTRNKLFTTIIYPALNKLVENIIHTWKFYNYETNYADLKSETIIYLYNQLDKFKPETGSKAFSYFTVITRNYLIKTAKDLKASQDNRYDLDVVDNLRNIPGEVYNENYTSTVQEFLKHWSDFVVTNGETIFQNIRDRSIAYAFVNVLDNSYELDITNKKTIYIFIKEQTGLTNSTHITNVMKRIKNSIKNNLTIYDRYGKIFSFDGDVEDLKKEKYGKKSIQE